MVAATIGQRSSNSETKRKKSKVKSDVSIGHSTTHGKMQRVFIKKVAPIG
jgi:hypothetical protein